MSTTEELFDAGADRYDRARRQLVPQLDAIYATVAGALKGEALEGRILELGAGTGLLSEFLLRHSEQCEITALDVSEAMLKVARARFDKEPRFSARPADYVTEPLGQDWHAVVSSLSIHHLSPDQRQALYARVHDALQPGGVFINADQVRADDAETEARWQQQWIDDARASGVSEQDLADSIQRQTLDRHEPLEVELNWLTNAGFVDVSCIARFGRFAVMVGSRPENPGG